MDISYLIQQNNNDNHILILKMMKYVDIHILLKKSMKINLLDPVVMIII